MKWTVRARNDLEAIHRFIANDSPMNARRVVEELLSRAEFLGVTPGIGRVVPEINDHDIREIPIHSWRLIYRVSEGDVFVLALVHKRRSVFLPSNRIETGGFMVSARRLAVLSFSCLITQGMLAQAALAQQPPNTVTVSPQQDPGVYSGRLKVNYPTPYELATVEQIRAVVDRVHAYAVEAAPVRAIDGDTGEAAPDLDKLPANVALARTDLQIITYEWGVTYAGMLLLAQVTGDARFGRYVDERVTAIAKIAAHARANLKPGTTHANYPRPAHGIWLRGTLIPGRLDDAGAMCAAFIKAERAGLGGKTLEPWSRNWLDWVSSKQFRLKDGTLARNRPLPNTLWLDDLYMSVPCLAQAGRLTGERRYYDDAARQILQFADRMFVKERKLFIHAWAQDMDPHPAFHWARANGWAIMAMAELLDVLPENHPARAKILDLFKQHATGLAAHQGHAGLWHQLLDRRESYEETSASAMYVFAIARGINRGWLDGKAFGPAIAIGWNAVAGKVNAKGQVENVCVGTGVGWEPMFYMYRPTHLLAAHGYGPVLLAGAEMIELRKQPDIGIHDGGMHFGRALEN